MELNSPENKILLCDLIASEIKRNLTLNVTKEQNDIISFNLLYDGKPIGSRFLLEADIRFETDYGHGGQTYADGVQLGVTEV